MKFRKKFVLDELDLGNSKIEKIGVMDSFDDIAVLVINTSDGIAVFDENFDLIDEDELNESKWNMEDLFSLGLVDEEEVESFELLEEFGLADRNNTDLRELYDVLARRFSK